MADGLISKPPARVPGRPFEKGRSGNPAGRKVGCRDKATIAAPRPTRNGVLQLVEADCPSRPGPAAGI